MVEVALPDRAHVVVIGGGVIGCSVAYHLAHLGQDVVLVERDRVTSGTTWHAAGLIVRFGSTSQTSTELRSYTRELYSKLEAETGVATGFKPVGFIEAAADEGRLEEYRRVSAFNRFCGVDVHEISPKEIGELFPLARTDDLLAGFYIEDDGRVNPVDVTMSLAKGARLAGATVVEGIPVTDVLTKRGAVAGVRTTRGDIDAEYVVNCTGMWARQLGARSGVSIPLQAAEHYYLITEHMQEISSSWPVLEDPSSYGYYREEGGGLMVGLFEPVSAPWNVGGIPDDFSFGDLKPDWDRMGPFVEKAMSRVPATLDVGIRKFFCGPESFTPDLAPAIGEAPELPGYFVAAGLNSIGILTGGGIGRLLAHWIVDGRADMDITGINIDRLHAYQTNPEYRATRTVEALGQTYACHYPTKAMQTARGVKTSALHDRLADQGAYFRDVSGWEGPDWYAGEGVTPTVDRLSWGRERWFTHWEAEHCAVRSSVGLIDMSFMSKFRVQGRDAGPFLNHISAGHVDGQPGIITYTQWLNDGGTLEADLTVTKLADDSFWVVASDTAHRHVETWMHRHLTVGAFADAHAHVTDVTGGYAQINVQGPRSRDLLQTVTSADLSNQAFPFRCARGIDIGFARVLCVRITYVGELGYELYVPTEQATHVYDRLLAAGRAVGLRHVGLRALGSLRMEKGYRDYGHDIDNTDSVLEAGLGFAVDLDKPAFVGREAVIARKAEGPLHRRLVQVLVQDPEPLMWHAEPVLRDGKPMGYVRAASYGWTLGGAVGLTMIDTDDVPITQGWLDAGDWQVEIAGGSYPASVSLRPMYDPKMERVRA
jgi:heterotetrameric sarcosine oxidase gamma subunit